MVVVYLPVTAFRSILPQLTEGIWPMVDEEDSFPSFCFHMPGHETDTCKSFTDDSKSSEVTAEG